MALRILLADDEKDFVETLAERLELRGHNVHVVFDGIAALNAAASAGKRFVQEQNSPEYDLKRLIALVAVENEGVKIIVPVEYRIVQNQNGNYRFGQRQHHLHEIGKMRAAVQYRCFIQIIRNGILYKRSGDNQVIGIDRNENDQDRLRGNQMQCTHGHIGRYQSAAEEHGKDKIEHDAVSCLEILT